jgi:hypothetical protein
MDKIKEIYLELLPKNIFKSRRAEVMVYKHCLRGYLHDKLKLDYRTIARIESELYGGKVDHTTIMNSIINYNNRQDEYLFYHTLDYITTRFEGFTVVGAE